MNILQRGLRRIINSCYNASERWGGEYSYDQMPPEAVRAAISLPWVKERMAQFSIDEYNSNPYYSLVINNLGDHTIGPSPGIIATSSRVDDRENDLVEDAYHSWAASNGIGHVFRDMRKEAAKTGLAIAIPFISNMLRPNPLTFKVYGFECLETPMGAIPSDRIINGVEYDRNWEIAAFHVKDNDDDLNAGRFIGDSTKEYRVEEVLWWARNRVKGMIWPMPECYSAFTFYPFVKRYLQAVIEGEEFKASFPMAVELDPKVFSAYASKMKTKDKVSGSFEYDTKTVPTLAPGMTLAGMPHTVGSKDQERTMQMFAATCALSVSMPKNLALGDSSNSNMASAQVDIQPWANKVKIDRFDMEPVFRQAFKWWWDLSVRIEMPSTIRRKHLLNFPHYYVYPDLFEHPDPNKRASARALDLASGAATLNRLYSNRGLNFRREMERESKALGIEVQELIEIIISSRSVNALSVVNEEAGKSDEPAPQGART